MHACSVRITNGEKTYTFKDGFGPLLLALSNAALRRRCQMDGLLDRAQHHVEHKIAMQEVGQWSEKRGKRRRLRRRQHRWLGGQLFPTKLCLLRLHSLITILYSTICTFLCHLINISMLLRQTKNKKTAYIRLLDLGVLEKVWIVKLVRFWFQFVYSSRVIASSLDSITWVH